jgi:hypothetical protein
VSSHSRRQSTVARRRGLTGRRQRIAVHNACRWFAVDKLARSQRLGLSRSRCESILASMVGRWRVLLPFQISVRSGDSLSPEEFTRDGYVIRIHKPYRSNVDYSDLRFESPAPLHHVTEQLTPAEPQPLIDRVQIDGAPVVLADAVQIDFIREEFDRRIGADDPPMRLMLAVLTGFLSRLRAVAQAPHVRPPEYPIYRLTFLNDDGSEFEHHDSLHRHRVAAGFHVEALGLNEDVWRAVGTLPDDYRARRWDDLLLDARDLLPEFGAALVLAATAVEIRLEDALNYMASTAVKPPGLWKWINDRDDYRKEPSILEQSDVLMKQLAGRSLKENPKLWEAFQQLRAARNSFVHQGVAAIKGTPVDLQASLGLISSATEIVSWIEQFLPADQRKPSHPTMNWQFTKPFIGPQGGE